jgi:hypothetical protein
MKPQIELIKTALLSDFPSGSSINYHQQKFFLIGDDATNILVLDHEYKKVDSIHLFDYSETRIPKADKTDLEGSVIVNSDGHDQLLIVGSASRKNRKRIILIPFSDGGLNLKAHNMSLHKTKAFVKRIKSHGIEEVNLEGVCLVNGTLLLGNRGNRSNQNNHIIVTEPDFWTHQDDAKLRLVKVRLPMDNGADLLGLSELCYLAEHDLLLVTLTTEETGNSYDDGAIGNSCLGWITDASKKLESSDIALDGVLKLSDIDPVFNSQKIEGVCAESVSEQGAVLHLIADNDCAESRLFKIQLSL